MARSLLDSADFKPQFAGHETFPLRYGWLKKAYDAVTLAIAKGQRETKTIFTEEAAVASFGVGKNMVVAMRHWALAAGMIDLAKEGDDAPEGHFIPTRLGKLILGSEFGDPYLEHPASLWLVHWHFCATPERTTTWYLAFNEMNDPVFDREMLRQRVLRRCDELRELGRLKESRITETTIRRDVECFIRTYASRSANGRIIHEDNLESPLEELSLIQPIGVGGAFQFRRGPKPTLPDEVFLFGLHSYWTERFATRREFSVESLTHEPGSPGRVFQLDEDSIADRLARLADLTHGAIRWDESTGMRQIYAHNLKAIDPIEKLSRLYARELHLESE